MRPVFIVIFLALLFSSGGCDHQERAGTTGKTTMNTLYSKGKEDGWHALFDGRTLSGWRGLGLDSIPHAYWRTENGTIHKVARNKVSPGPDGSLPPACDLMTVDTFLNFEFFFEWKIAPKGNSGIKYNVSEAMSTAGGSTHALGFEYQIIDDENYPAILSPLQHTAALYALVPPQGAQPRPAGQWNRGRIILNGHHGEHWLNGKKVVEFELGTPAFDSLFRKSKYHKYPAFPEKRYGHIVLQDHADDVWFRNLKIRKL
jgi:hypothetical protein